MKYENNVGNGITEPGGHGASAKRDTVLQRLTVSNSRNGGGIRQFLQNHRNENPISFHMPGHKGQRLYREYGYSKFLDNIMDMDITEIPGADNLFQAESIISETMAKYRNLYDSKESYLLVNGSSGGLISAILSSVNQGGKLLMARNCHKSIFNALSLGGIEPVYLYPEIIEEYGISGQIDPKKVATMLDENPEIQAVVIPSPNYYGICSDIGAIAEECHKRDKIVIVDQAHGAHLKMMEKFGGKSGENYPESAESQGADIVINSVHKTLASWTQSAVLNVCSDRVDTTILADKLQVIESSSPSYPMMATLDINADLLLNYGEKLMNDWAKNIEYFYDNTKAIHGLKVLTAKELDSTKINIDMSYYGLNGNQLEAELNKRHIYPELVAGNLVMCMTGIGNTRKDFETLLIALMQISISHNPCFDTPKQIKSIYKTLDRTDVPKRKKSVRIDDALGKVCASSVIPYPPGIPLVCPGEIFDREVIDHIKELRAAKEKVIGLDAENNVLVGE